MKQYFDTKTVASVAAGIIVSTVAIATAKALGQKAGEVVKERRKKKPSLKAA